MENKINPEYRKALNRVAFLFYAPLTLFLFFSAVIAIVWSYKIEYLAVINTYMKDIGIVGFLQKYVMPAWKNQEIQLIKEGYKEIGILHNASTLFTLIYTFFVFMAVLFKFKMYYQDFLTINVVKKKHAKIMAYAVVPLMAVFSALGSILFLVPRKFDFVNTWKGLTPTLGGIYKNDLSIFVLLDLTFIIVLFFIPVSLKISKRYAQSDEPK